MSDASPELVPVLKELAAALQSMRDELARQDPNRWDTLRNEAQKAMMAEMQAQRRVTSALTSVLGDVRDELALFRTELRYLRDREERDARFAALSRAEASSSRG